MITFYFPHWNKYDTTRQGDTPGGTQVLTIHICEALNKKNIVPKLITYKGGYVYETAIEKKIQFLFIDSNQEDFQKHIDRFDVLVVFSGYFIRDYEVFKKTNIRFFYWSVYPDHLLQTFSSIKKLSKLFFAKDNPLNAYLIRMFVYALLKDNALFFMEISHYHAIKKYGIKIDNAEKNIIPIPFQTPDLPLPNRNRVVRKNEINICYLGRAEVWKIYPLLKLLTDANDLKNIDNNINIKVHIITDDKKKILKYIRSYSVFGAKKNISLNLIDGLKGKDLEKYLVDEIDILFAMGMSLFEGAKLCIPSVIIDPSPVELPESYRYRWLYEESGYSLGYPIWLLGKREGMQLESLIDSILKRKNGFADEGKKCFDYIKKAHNIDDIINKFIYAVDHTNGKFFNYRKIYLISSFKGKIKKKLTFRNIGKKNALV
jgi:hypothetical protein